MFLAAPGADCFHDVAAPYGLEVAVGFNGQDKCMEVVEMKGYYMMILETSLQRGEEKRIRTSLCLFSLIKLRVIFRSTFNGGWVAPLREVLWLFPVQCYR